ncbi:extracellular solute-binding protein [Candidatus Halobonum tyrrellensis]|uniref:ABC-type transport system periplasmic substrate-binding protein n=1 Tax=Candidatus Halobonum tyrrellensis G22 TaxID=1324957 RepID=V4HH69_9EURY|nr:extracellular solute-binding protein [Candidatus Halobonum tyrrellensis]ESP90105.1 ABC-type transport system periplasmic substrate-binding protein [Candidatus Halobonum tyrrellensis G22]
MATQRRGSAGPSRRGFLRAVGAAGVAGVAGCSGGAASGDGGRVSESGTATDGARTGVATTDRGGSAPVSVLAAGSLQNALTNGLVPAVDAPVRVETHGSATVARMVQEGQRDPDIVAVADTSLFEGPLSPPWYSVFTSNSVVVAYNPDTEGGRRLAEADRWYEPLVEGAVGLGRTDPDQDPLGYRTLFALDLASRYYDDAPDLREAVLDRDQIYPETALVSQFETGSVDAAVAYRNMAVERGYEYVDLPDRVDLSDPRYADDWYSTVSYTLPSGQTVRGGVISYGATVRHASDAARSVFDALTTGDYLAEHGFLPREAFPAYEGDVPDRVVRVAGGAGADRSSTSRSNGSRPDGSADPPSAVSDAAQSG